MKKLNEPSAQALRAVTPLVETRLTVTPKASAWLVVTPLVITLLASGMLVLVGCSAPQGEDSTVLEVAEDSSRLSSEDIAQEVLSSMDLSVDPCQDFYRYACGGWLDSNEIPGDETRWVRSFSVIEERNREAIREMLASAAAAPGDAGTDRYRVATYYGSCMDEEAVDAAGVAPLGPLLAKIEGVEDASSLMRVTGELQRHAVEVLFTFGGLPDFKNPGLEIAFFLQGGLGMPDRDYYLSADPGKVELLAAYEQHIAQVFRLLGESEANAATQAAQVVAFESSLATASRPRQELRIPEKLYNKLDLSGLQQLTPGLPWDEYLAAIGRPDLIDINVATPEFFEALDKLVASSQKEDLQSYLRWSLVRTMSGQLSSDFVTADFEFFGARLEGQQQLEPRWKHCVELTQSVLGEPLGKIYVENFFPGSSKEVALTMIQDVEKAFEANLPALAWMDDATRSRAVEKAQAVKNKIGYPDTWRDFSGLTLITGDFFGNYLATATFDFDFQAGKIGQPVDPNEWGMSPQTVNAYYNPLGNEMAFPAGILQPPFFHRDFPTAMNYGAMGAVMGHELSHGFDDQGRKFSPAGKLEPWWEPEASERFEEQAGCVADLYSSYEIEPGQSVNGRLTLGENIADLGGVKQAFKAYKTRESEQGSAGEPFVEGLTNDQLFFVAYSQVWCGLTTPEQSRVLLATDSHSPTQFRVKGPLSNNPDLAEVFGCPAESPMVAKNRCEVW